MRFAEWRQLLEAYLRPHRRMVALLAVFLFAGIALQVATPQLVRRFIDGATSSRSDDLVVLTTVYVLAVLAQQGCQLVAAWLAEIVGWLTTNELRADLMAHCLSLDADFHQTHSPGELIERIDGDISGLSLFFSQFLLRVVGNGLLLLGVLGVLWHENAAAGAALTGLAAVAVLALVLVRRIPANAWQRSREASAVLFGYVEERLAGTQDIRSSGAEAHVLRGFYAHARDRTWITTRARVLDAFQWSTNNVLVFGIQSASFIVPAVLVRDGSITIGTAFVLYFYAQLLLLPLQGVGDQVQQLQQAIAGGRRVVELLRIESGIADGEGEELPAGALELAFRDVTFGYGQDPDLFLELNISVPAGQVLGVVGRTGSGKSSLARLVVRLHDVRSGAVTLDGVDVRELTVAQLRGRVALVTQEVHVLRATVRDNLTLFNDALDDDLVLDAVRRLGLGAWFAALPDGLDTMVREGGAGLSAGEAQLLSLGRALLADPSVVILDEASSRLDPATEALLEHALDTLLEGRTAIVIAHRLATLDRCDSIAVFEHGRLVEHGSRRELAGTASSRFGALLRTGLDVLPT